jgi:hypothetical protein
MKHTRVGTPKKKKKKKQKQKQKKQKKKKKKKKKKKLTTTAQPYNQEPHTQKMLPQARASERARAPREGCGGVRCAHAQHDAAYTPTAQHTHTPPGGGFPPRRSRLPVCAGAQPACPPHRQPRLSATQLHLWQGHAQQRRSFFDRRNKHTAAVESCVESKNSKAERRSRKKHWKKKRGLSILAPTTSCDVMYGRP